MTVQKSLPVLAAGLGLLIALQATPIFAQDDVFSDDALFTAQSESGSQGRFAPPQRPGMKDRKEAFLQELGLTEAQKQKLQSIMQSQRESSKGNRQALQQKRQQLMQMLKSGSGSKQQALALHQEISREQSRMMEQRINTLYEMRSVLSPEQFQKLSQMMQQRRGAQGGPGGGMRRGGQGGSQGGRFGGPQGGAGFGGFNPDDGFGG